MSLLPLAGSAAAAQGAAARTITTVAGTNTATFTYVDDVTQNESSPSPRQG